MKHIILDTDIFGDPDDLFALVYALSKKEIQIDLIVTADEYGHRRATETKGFLAKAGETIPVVAGLDLHNTKYVFVHESEQPDNQEDFIAAIHAVVTRNDHTEYVCIAPQSNLAAYLRRYPEHSSKLTITAMGSSRQLFFDRVEHNVRLDIPAVQLVSSHCPVIWVMADQTVHDKLAFNRKHELYSQLKDIDNDVAKRVCRNIDDFFDAFGYEYSYYHDPLTVSVLLHDYVTFTEENTEFDSEGRMTISSGSPAKLSAKVNYDQFVSDFTSSILRYLSSR